MRYLTFSTPGDTAPRLGVLRGRSRRGRRSLPAARRAAAPASLLDLIHQGPAAWRRLPDVPRGLKASGYQARSYRSDEIRWHAPIPRPSKNVFCVGRNYLTHIEEGARARGVEVKLPDAPVFFTKAPTSVIGPVRRHPVGPLGHAAGGLGGRAGRHHRRDRPQHPSQPRRSTTSSATRSSTTYRRATCRRTISSSSRARASTASARSARVVVTADEFGDPHGKQITLRVNGVAQAERQHARHDLSRRRDHRIAVARPDARGRRYHRLRHAGRLRASRARRPSSCRTATSWKRRSKVSGRCATASSRIP